MLHLDHLVITSPTLECAEAFSNKRLPFTSIKGGCHAHFATHNRLIILEKALYLELISPDPALPKPQWSRWFNLDHVQRPALTHWVVQTQSLTKFHRKFADLYREPIALQRDDLKWKMLLPFDEQSGSWPGVIDWGDTPPPAQRLKPSGLQLEQLRISGPDARALQKRLAPLLQDHKIVFDFSTKTQIKAVFTDQEKGSWQI